LTHEQFWAEAMAELMSRPPKPEVDPLPMRSTEFSDGFSVKLTSLGDYRLFAYYSVPHGDGPFPAIYHAPGYASVVGVPPYEERRRHVCLSLCARGQRLSDRPYAAAFPGLLTDRVDDPAVYPFRGIVADACRGVDFLKLRPEVDHARIAVVGADMALFAAALRPEVRAAVVADPFLPRLFETAPTTSAYPHEEVNDYLRSYPEHREAVRATLDLFDPTHLAGRIKAAVLITCPPSGGPFDRAAADRLAAAIGPKATVYPRTGKGYLDRVHVEEWIATSLRS
jgi:cephalosporin-C deacetylase-like acetyl esterase